jgi:hypothetical protein
MKKRFWLLTILYFVAIILGIYAMVEAYQQKNDFNLFIRGVLVFIWSVFLVNRMQKFYKERNTSIDHNNQKNK